MTWTRTVDRDLSPFFGIGDVSGLLGDATIVPWPGEEPVSVPDRVLDPAEMANLAPTIHPGLSADELEAALGRELLLYDLILTVETPQLLRRTIAGRWRCDGPIPEAIEVESEALVDGILAGTLEIGLAICLREGAEPRVGYPELPGARLAGKTFAFGIDRRQSTFSFEELTGDLRRERGLPDMTTFVLDLDKDDLVPPADEDRPMAVVYLAPTLLNALRSGSLKAGAVTMLTTQIMDAVLEEAVGLPSDTFVVEGSGLERLLEWASGGGTRMDWIDFRAKIANAPHRRALVQHELGTSAALAAIR